MSTHDNPLKIEDQIILMKKYVTFTKRVRIRRFLNYAGYFRASRYGKYLLSHTGVIGSKPNQDLLFNIYEFDNKLRELFLKYCKRAEIQFKSHLSNSISIKTGSPTFYLDDTYYTPSKGERDRMVRQSNIRCFDRFKSDIISKEFKLRRDNLKYPELNEYRCGGSRDTYKIPSWAAFSYFEFGTVTYVYSYLKGDLRKEVLVYGYSKHKYGKEATKNMDTWLDAIRNLRNVCAHHNMLVGKTSSVVLFDREDSEIILNLGNTGTDLFSRLYALKKILSKKDSDKLVKDLKLLIRKNKIHNNIDIYSMNILPENWESLFIGIKYL